MEFLPFYDNQAQIGGKKTYFFLSMTIEHKLVITNRISSLLYQSSTNWWQQIVLLPFCDNRAQIGGNKSYFFPSMTIERKLVAINRTSSLL